MNASATVWRAWAQQVKALLPGVPGHRSKTLALFVFGVICAGSLRLPKIAESLLAISAAKAPSLERRLARFLANEQINARQVWTQFLAPLLKGWQEPRVVLLLDCTPIAAHSTVVYLGVLAHSRVLPLAWQVMPGQTSWDQGLWAVVATLMEQVTPHLPPVECTLLADRGLTCLALIRLCQAHSWHYLLRLESHETCLPQVGRPAGRWWRFDRLIQKPGQSWFGPAVIWQEYQFPAWVSAAWVEGYREPWFLVSDQSAGKRQLAEYAKRMRVEATFEDTKRRGWELESTLVRERGRLERLLLVLFLALWWLAHLAAACLRHGKRGRFDRHDRRDKGIFR